MELKMYAIGEGSGVVNWICATTKEEAIKIHTNLVGDMTWEEVKDSVCVREMDQEEKMTYYHDGINPENDTIKNYIEKYCDGPDIFATSDF